MITIIEKNFYQVDDVVKFSKMLLGKVICTKVDNVVTKGIITETEAYSHKNDRASHAFNGKRTKRNEAMYAEGGTTYVYLCYGMYPLLNIVSNKANIPDAALIRSIWIIEGIEEALKRRKQKTLTIQTCNGPGKAAMALGITMQHNFLPLKKESGIWLEDHNIVVEDKDIITSPRIGVDYAGEDAMLPYNFKIKENVVKQIIKKLNYEYQRDTN